MSRAEGGGRRSAWDYPDLHAHDADRGGAGWYSAQLVAVLSAGALAMAVDMFGFSVVVAAAACELQFHPATTGLLLSMPFLGPIVMSYAWGYANDTSGRRRCLLVALWSSGLVAAAGALSPNWQVMALLKFISTSMCSCAQSATYTLLGECCPRRVRDRYMLVMTSVLDFSLAVYVVVAYFILKLEFSQELGFIRFTSWRLLALALAAPLLLAAGCLHAFYESPKFLLNVHREDDALNNLRGIWSRNGGCPKDYPVKRIHLEEEGNERSRNITFVQSMWEQLAPIFKPPLLSRTIQLYFVTAVVYGTNNAYFIWFPLLALSFVSGESGVGGVGGLRDGLCDLIAAQHGDDTAFREAAVGDGCSYRPDGALVWSALAQGVVFVAVLLAASCAAHRRRLLMLVFLLVAGGSAVGAATIADRRVGLVMYFGLLLNELCIGFIFSYFVDLYPTSFRGTAACLGVLVARGSALLAVNLLSSFVRTNCALTFYVSAALHFCAAIVTAFLPPDKLNKWKD